MPKKIAGTAAPAPYQPRPGSVLTKVLDYLAANPQATLTKEDIAAAYGCASVSVAALLRPAIKAGLITVRREGLASIYGLGAGTAPTAEPEPAGPLQIATWNDGDVLVKGHIENVDGTITFSRAQIQQLITHVTTPHIALPAARVQPAAA